MSKYALRVSFDASDSFNRGLASAVSLSRHACILLSSLAVDMRVQVEDVPVVGDVFFQF